VESQRIPAWGKGGKEKKNVGRLTGGAGRKEKRRRGAWRCNKGKKNGRGFSLLGELAKKKEGSADAGGWGNGS